MTCTDASHDLNVDALRCPVNTPIPWHGRAVTLIAIDHGHVTQAKTVVDKTKAATSNATLLAAWVGEYSTDVFHVCEDARQNLLDVLKVPA